MPDTNLAILLDRFVRRLHLALHQKAPDFDTEKVGPGGAILLLTLAEMGETPMHALTKRLLRDKSQMTRAVRPLEQKGLIRREQSQKDCRINMIALTDKGQQVVDTHQRVVAETIDEILSPLSDTDQEKLRTLLQRAVS
ncbi:MAG: MarR family transcriptional regulator [Pseudomonadota bacterium]